MDTYHNRFTSTVTPVSGIRTQRDGVMWLQATDLLRNSPVTLGAAVFLRGMLQPLS